MEWCENELLNVYYTRLDRRSIQCKRQRNLSIASSIPLSTIASTSPRKQLVEAAATVVLDQHPLGDNVPYHPISILMQAFSSGQDNVIEVLEMVADEFVKVQVPLDTVVWRIGDDSNELYVLEHGTLVLSIQSGFDSEGDSVMQVVETLLPGTMVGELEFLTERPRSCCLTASTDVVCW